MTSIVPLLSSPFLQQATTQTAQAGLVASALQSQQAQAPQSSTTVILGQSNPASPVYVPLFPQASAPMWEMNSGDDASTIMARNFASSSLAGRFQDLGSALIKQLAGGANNYSQSVYQPAPGSTPSASLNGVVQTTLHNAPENQVSLEITTRSGAKVQITLGSQENGLAASISVTGGQLSDAERDSILKLADGFQSALDGLTANPPKLDLGGLVQFDTSTLASVDLHATVDAANGQGPQTVDFHADSTQRSVQMNGPLGKLQIDVDMSNPAIQGSADQQAQALAAYLKQFDAERSRGNGDATLMAMFTSAFTALNSHYVKPNPADATTKPLSISPAGRSLLSGLADFNASVTQAQKSINPLRPDEVDGFDYTVSQQTAVQARSPLDYAVTQTQQSHLRASFHKSLSPGVDLQLTTDKTSQNYYYDEIEDNAQSQAKFAYARGNLTQASLAQTASQSTREREYMGGVLQQDNTTPYSQGWAQDLLSVLNQPQQSGTAGVDAQSLLLSRIHDLATLTTDPYKLARKQPVQ